jgi:hypothetical protein
LITVVNGEVKGQRVKGKIDGREGVVFSCQLSVRSLEFGVWSWEKAKFKLKSVKVIGEKGNVYLSSWRSPDSISPYRGDEGSQGGGVSTRYLLASPP